MMIAALAAVAVAPAPPALPAAAPAAASVESAIGPAAAVIAAAAVSVSVSVVAGVARLSAGLLRARREHRQRDSRARTPLGVRPDVGVADRRPAGRVVLVRGRALGR